MSVNWPITVITRASNNAPLNATQFDNNLTTLRDASNELNDRVEDIEDGTTTVPNADKVDKFHASQSPVGGQIPVLNSSGQLPLPFAQTPILVNGQDMMYRTFYVDAVNGDDSNDGSESAPFKTIKKACNSVPVGGYGVIYLSGDYTLTQNVYLINKIIYIYVPGNSILKPSWYLYNNQENRLNSFHLKGSSNIIFDLHDGAKILLDDEGFDSSYSQNYGWFIQKYTYCIGFISVFGSNNYTNKVQIEIAGSDSSPVFMSHGDLHSLEALVLHLWKVDIIKSGNGYLTSGDGVFGLKASNSSVKDGSGNSLEWSDVVSGIVKDANGVPRNIISNIVF